MLFQQIVNADNLKKRCEHEPVEGNFTKVVKNKLAVRERTISEILLLHTTTSHLHSAHDASHRERGWWITSAIFSTAQNTTLNVFIDVFAVEAVDPEPRRNFKNNFSRGIRNTFLTFCIR